MENQAPKRRGKDDIGFGSNRISQLPESLLLHILCFVSHKEAVRTSVLSKSWRHLGPTRPVIDLHGDCDYVHVRGINDVCDDFFDKNNEAFLSVLENTLQRYHDQNLSTQVLRLRKLDLDSQSILLLEKWIPIFIKPNSGVTTFHLSFKSDSKYFNLPSVVFKAEYLQELDLDHCSLSEINSIDNVLLKNLQKLSLVRVDIVDDAALEKLIAGCPLVKCVVLYYCHGFKTINIANKNPYLNHFLLSGFNGNVFGPDIEIDAPTLQRIRIDGRSNWCPNPNNYFPHLKSLYLSDLVLSSESFGIFSCNFPRLEELTLFDCCGFEEITLFSRSINRLIIAQTRICSIKKVAIEVPNILYFEFSATYNLPTTFSLTTTSTEWKSHLSLHKCLYFHGNDVLGKILKLFEMAKALIGSQISLSLSEAIYHQRSIKHNLVFNDHPVVVEHMDLNVYKTCHDFLTHLLNALFRIFRPRYINAVRVSGYNDKEATDVLWKTLIHGREKTEYGWEQHLEEVNIEASNEKGKAWHHIERAFLPEWSKNPKIRFGLKWRD